MAREIGDSAPQLAYGEEGRRGHGSSGAAATGRDSDRAIRESRIAHRLFTGPSFRTLIAAKDGEISPFFRRPIAGPSASWKSRKKYRLD